MKKLLTFLFLLCSLSVLSQTAPPNYTNINSRYQWLAGRFKALSLPAGDTVFQSGQWPIAGTVVYDSSGGAGLRVWNGLYWQSVGGGGGGLSGGNLGSGWRWYDPEQQALRTFTPDVGLLFDTTTAGELRAAVDTSIMATRAWRQKGLDSLGLIIEANRPMNRILAAAATNTINNAAYTQTWQWNSLNGGSGLKIEYTGSTNNSHHTSLVDISFAGSSASATGDSSVALRLSNTTSSTGRRKYALRVESGNVLIKDTLRLSEASTTAPYMVGSNTQFIFRSGNAGNAILFQDVRADFGGGARFYPQQNFTFVDGSGLNGVVLRTPSGFPRRLNIYDSTVVNILMSFSGSGVVVGSETIEPSAIMNVVSSNKGFLAPRMSTTSRDAIASPASGLLIYNTSSSKFNFYNGASWQEVGTGSGSGINNANVGSGYRLLKPDDQGIKTLYAGNGITIDSTTNTNGITITSTAPNLTVQTLTDGSTITWDVSNGVNAQVTLGGTGRTLSISNAVAGQTYTIRVIQDGSGNKTISTWPTNTKWPGGIGPALSTGANKYDIVVFYYDGTNYYGTYQLDFQ